MNNRKFVRYFSPLMVAAGKTGKATCRGDSGGPLFFRGGETTYQVGITSYGIGCGAGGWPKVFTETNAGPIGSFIFEAAARRHRTATRERRFRSRDLPIA